MKSFRIKHSSSTSTQSRQIQAHMSIPAGLNRANITSTRHQAAFTAPCPNSIKQSRRALVVTAAVKKTSAKNVACSMTLVANAGQEETVFKLCQDVVEYTRDVMKNKASGIIAFDCSRDGFENNTFHFWEIYESNAHLGRHHTDETVKSFMENVQQHLEGPVGMALYEYKNGQLGNVCVQGGPKGEGGLDDATGATGAAGGAGLKQTSGTVDLTKTTENELDTSQSLWGIKLPWMTGNDKK